MARDTEKFLRLMNQANDEIAERLAKEAEEEAQQKNLRGDPVRLAADAARREKWGQLRAREHLRSRPTRSRHAFGVVNMRPSP